MARGIGEGRLGKPLLEPPPSPKKPNFQLGKSISPRIIFSTVSDDRSGMSGIMVSLLGRRRRDFVASTPSRRT